VRTGLAAFGEIGLTGRLRPATQGERRLEECAKFSVAAVVGPQGTPERRGTQVLVADTIRRALALGLVDRQEPAA
jgi:DNA repair protein RadA/Sms